MLRGVLVHYAPEYASIVGVGQTIVRSPTTTVLFVLFIPVVRYGTVLPYSCTTTYDKLCFYAQNYAQNYAFLCLLLCSFMLKLCFFMLTFMLLCSNYAFMLLCSGCVIMLFFYASIIGTSQPVPHYGKPNGNMGTWDLTRPLGNTTRQLGNQNH